VFKAQHSKHFQWKHEKGLDASGSIAGRVYAESGEGWMTLILGFFGAALLAGTGIYNPQFMHNGRCTAEPGGIYALYYCVPEPAAPPHKSRR